MEFFLKNIKIKEKELSNIKRIYLTKIINTYKRKFTVKN